MNSRHPILFVLFALLFASSACITGGDPLERSLSRSRNVVSSGVQAGLQASDNADSLRIQARYNPCRCDAPDFELRVRGRWERYVLNGDPALLEELQAAALLSIENDDPLRFWYLEGAFRGTRKHPSGGEYPLFRLESIQD